MINNEGQAKQVVQFACYSPSD